MPKIRFHKVAAIAVFLATAAWVATGEFSSVGSAADETPAEQPAQVEQTEAALPTVAVINPPQVEHSRAIRVSGYTEADQRTEIATRAAGIVEELPARLGARVEAGDLILKLEAEGKAAAVETAKQLLAQREAEAEAARKLAEAGNLARLQLDNTLSALASARSGLELAQAELERTVVRAPFDGIIDEVHVELGGSVAAGAPVATLLKLDPIRAIGQISERDVIHVGPGDRAEVRLVNGQATEGEVLYVSRNADPQTRTFRVEVVIPNEDSRIPAGMTAEITLRAEPVASTILPRSVVTLNGSGDLGIRAVDENGEVVFYPIDLVDDTGEGLVLAGIPADARIIVSGQEMAVEGELVRAVEADRETLDRLVGDATGGMR